jgi:hypothetical protein
MNEYLTAQNEHENPFTEGIKTQRDFYKFALHYYKEHAGGERKIISRMRVAMVNGNITYSQFYKLKELIKKV